MINDLINYEGVMVTLRTFEHLSELNDEVEFEGMDSNEVYLIENWRENIEKILPIYTQIDVINNLRAMGVYEISANLKEGRTDLSLSQKKSISHYLLSEERICENAFSALIRYFSNLDKEEVYFYEELPEKLTKDNIGKYVEFDGVSFSTDVVEDHVLFQMAWRPDWDIEHGLNMLFYKEEVIMMGKEEIRLMLDYPASFFANGTWSIGIMNDDEKLAFETVMNSLNC